jgi:hypothetical protein
MEKDGAGFSVRLRLSEGAIAKHQLFVAFIDQLQTVSARIRQTLRDLPHWRLPIRVRTTGSKVTHRLAGDTLNKKSHRRTSQKKRGNDGISPRVHVRNSPLSGL